jgi:uncharacterized protein YbjT (DUF2867 family)
MGGTPDAASWGQLLGGWSQAVDVPPTSYVMPKYVVAGATGRVGSAVASELIRRGVRPTVIVRGQGALAEWTARGADSVIGSLADPAFLTKALQRAAGFFVLLPENVQTDDFHGARRRMAETIAEAVASSQVPHVVMLSAIAASIADGNGPAKDLHYLENLLRRTRANITILRSAYFQDNVASAVTPAKHLGIYPHFFPSDDVAFPMIATKDSGAFAAQSLLEPSGRSETALLLGPAYSARDIAAKLGTALGKPVQVVAVPPAARLAALTGAGVPRQLAEAVVEMMDALGAGKIIPAGDKKFMGSTVIDDVIRQMIGASPA